MGYKQDQERDKQLAERARRRALRITNKHLRAKNAKLELEGQQNFIAACTTKTLAEEALRRLWDNSDLLCGPEDYEYVVDSCLAALAYVKSQQETGGIGTQPVPASIIQFFSRQG